MLFMPHSKSFIDQACLVKTDNNVKKKTKQNKKLAENTGKFDQTIHGWTLLFQTQRGKEKVDWNSGGSKTRIDTENENNNNWYF